MKQSATRAQRKKNIQAAQSVLDSLPEHIAILDRAGEIITTNDSWNKFAAANGVTSLSRVGPGQNYLEVCEASAATDKRLARVVRNIKSVLDGTRGKFSVEYPSHSENNNRWFLLSVTPLKTGGRMSGAVVTHLDITRRKLAETETRRLAVTDPMTGILNRNAGMSFIQTQLKKCRKHKTSMTLCYIDLDNLKYVNDNFGHKEGDRVIISLVRIIKRALRETDVMFRMGGDEILVILPDTALEESSTVIDRINDMIEKKNLKSSKPYRIEFSYGLAEYSPDKKLKVEGLVDIADRNMYKMKTAKKRSAEIYKR